MIEYFKNSNNKRYYSIIETKILKQNYLKYIDTLVFMMNNVVVQFVTNNEKKKNEPKIDRKSYPWAIYDDSNNKTVSMVFCEKAVLGYCYLYHLLLLLKSKYMKSLKKHCNDICELFLKHKDGTTKKQCPDLGKLLIYVMLSDKYDWSDIAVPFIYELLTRNVRWATKDYPQLNTTKKCPNRLITSFEASKVSIRLVRFQVWFMNNVCNNNTNLESLNHRFGRPSITIRNKLQHETTKILNSKHWSEFFKALNINAGNIQNIDQLLRYAVLNSDRLKYHVCRNRDTVKRPVVRYMGEQKNRNINMQNNQIGLNVNNTNLIRHSIQSTPISAWRGRGRGRGRGANRGRGQGRGVIYQNQNQNQFRRPPQQQPPHQNVIRTPYQSLNQNRQINNNQNNNNVMNQNRNSRQHQPQPQHLGPYQPQIRPVNNQRMNYNNNNNLNNQYNNNNVAFNQNSMTRQPQQNFQPGQQQIRSINNNYNNQNQIRPQRPPQRQQPQNNNNNNNNNNNQSPPLSKSQKRKRRQQKRFNEQNGKK